MQSDQTKLKLIFLGDSYVGKSSTHRVLSGDGFAEPPPSTIGVEFRTMILKEGIKLLMFDTAGQERFNFISRQYLSGTNIIVLEFDVNRRGPFENLATWIEKAKNVIKDNYVEWLLIGNKNDLKCRAVMQCEAEEFALEHGMFYLDYSAKLDSGTIIRAKLEEVVEKYLSTKKLEEPAPANNPVQPLIPQQLPAPIPVPPQQPVQENKGCTLI